MSLRPLPALFAAALLCFASTVCTTATARTSHKKSSHHSESSGPPLVIRGDIVTSHGLVDAIAEAWEDTGNGHLEVQPFNTVSGIDAALSGSADIGASARAGFPGRAQEAGLNFTPVAWDALVMITSPDNPVGNITLKQLHDIYYGKIANWSELGGRDEPIDLYTVASPLDGADFSLRHLLYGRGNAPIMMGRSYINVDTLEQGIALDAKSLGLSTLSRVHDNKHVKIIPIEGVMPTTTTVADGSYPLYTAIYLASSPSNPHATQIAQFMDLLSSDDARKLMREHDLLPYADAPALQPPAQQLAAVTGKMVSEGLQESEAAKVGAHAETGTATAAVAAAPTSAPMPTAAPSSTVVAAAQASDAKVTASARIAKDPGVKHAEKVAPSNPVVISSGGTVTPVESVVNPDRPSSYTVAKG